MTGISILLPLGLTLLTEAEVYEKAWLAHAINEVQAVPALSLEVFVPTTRSIRILSDQVSASNLIPAARLSPLGLA